MTIRSEKNNLFLIIFLIIFLSSSFLVTNDIWSSAIVIGLWIVTLILVLNGLRKNGKRLYFSFRSSLFIFIILIVCIWITDFFRGENLLNTAKNTFSFGTVALLVYLNSFEEFKETYIKLFKFLALLSLVLFTLYQLIPSLNTFNLVTNLSGRQYSCLYLYVSLPGVVRNMGLFWEPGAYGTFLCIALLFEITKKEVKTKNIIIFLITIVTTFSTTAYIATIMIVLYALMLKRDMSRKVKFYILLLILAAVIIMFVNYEYFFGMYGHSTVFGKLLRYREGTSHTNYSSTAIRINAMKYAFLAYINSPIIGYGYSGLINNLMEYTLGMNTCTFINWFATYGTLFGIIMVSGYYKFAKKNTESNIQCFALLCILLVLTISENYVLNPFFMLICLLGHHEDFRKKEIVYDV